MKKLVLLIIVPLFFTIQMPISSTMLIPSELRTTYQFAKRWTGLLWGDSTPSASVLLAQNSPQVHRCPYSHAPIVANVEVTVRYQMPDSAELPRHALLAEVKFAPDTQIQLNDLCLKQLDRLKEIQTFELHQHAHNVQKLEKIQKKIHSLQNQIFKAV